MTLICYSGYYGKHYTAFFKNDALGCWLSFDDSQVTKLGPHWHSAIEKCKKSKFMPLLCFYELTDEPIPPGTCVCAARRVGRRCLARQAPRLASLGS